MTISRRLQAHRQALASAEPAAISAADTPLPDDQNDIDENDTDTKSKKKDKEMTEEEINALKAEAKAEGFKEANARMNAVFASTEYAGREKLAHSLLATSLSAEEIGVQLAAAPKIEPSALTAPLSAEAADEAQRAEMRDAISKTANAAIDVGSGGVAPVATEATGNWSAATAAANEMAGLTS